MNHEMECSIVNDLLPLYADGLTSEQTNTFVQKHLQECTECQKDYQSYTVELSEPEKVTDNKEQKEINYLKKLKTYQNINLILGTITSFLFGVCIPAVIVLLPIIINGVMPDYFLARLKIAWHIALFRMLLSGIAVCCAYLLIMLLCRKRIKNTK